HKMREKKYHQVSPTHQLTDNQFIMGDTFLKKSLTKYHQVSPTFLQVNNSSHHPDVHTLYTGM
ncbi:MAG: hypothetical protein KA499_01760, partial [Bacteroides sp.]|nr:hypothetical protein [Bacteroides sp.]